MGTLLSWPGRWRVRRVGRGTDRHSAPILGGGGHRRAVRQPDTALGILSSGLCGEGPGGSAGWPSALGAVWAVRGTAVVQPGGLARSTLCQAAWAVAAGPERVDQRSALGAQSQAVAE